MGIQEIGMIVLGVVVLAGLFWVGAKVNSFRKNNTTQ